MIPIRVPALTPVFTVGGARNLEPSHPLCSYAPCPVCDDALFRSPVILVLAGIDPDDVKDSGWTTGAAVAVHVACCGPNAISLEADFPADPIVVSKADLARYLDGDGSDLDAATEGLRRLWAAAGIEAHR